MPAFFFFRSCDLEKSVFDFSSLQEMQYACPGKHGCAGAAVETGGCGDDDDTGNDDEDDGDEDDGDGDGDDDDGGGDDDGVGDDDGGDGDGDDVAGKDGGVSDGASASDSFAATNSS
jgi:hypothetical protein